jgi:hypothetical protein
LKRFKLVSYLVAIATVFFCAGTHWGTEHILAAVALIGGMGCTPTLVFGACAELTAFRTAVESLDQRTLRSPRLGRAMFWRNMIPRSTFVKNQGVTRSTFTIKSSEPQDDQSLWRSIVLSSGQPTPSCDTNYEDIGVDFYERTYGPKKRRFRGPVICKANLTFQHMPEQFLNDYVDELGKVIARVWEFTLRGDYMGFVNWYVDGVKYPGPNALATLPRAFQGISQTNLNKMSANQINVGAGSDPDGGYTTLGPNGPIFGLEIDMEDSERVLTANSTIRDDARFASEGKDGMGDFSLWRPLGAQRVIGNFRHLPSNITPRFDYNGGYLQISPFKTITQVGNDGTILTDAYINADFGCAIMLMPQVFECEVVTPSDWKFPDVQNYNGEWEFVVGGERICDPPQYDPQHERGRHFAEINYAPRPVFPFIGAVYLYKRCPDTPNLIFCS